MDQETKQQVDMACTTAEDFAKTYYDSIDKRRSNLLSSRSSEVLQRFYMDSAVLVWNGNGVVGHESISKFLCELPLTEHKVGALDCQKVLDTAVGGKLAFMVSVAGMVKYGNKNPRSFSETFMLTSHNDKWKIVSDCFRCTEPL